MAIYRWPPKPEPLGFTWIWGLHGTARKGQSTQWRPGPPPHPGYVNFQIAPIKLQYVKGNLQIAAILTDTMPLVGAVLAYWGAFEVIMNDILASFVIADADPNDERWERRNFTKRSRLLKDKAKARFPGKIADEITSILHSAAVYHWQRNLIAHGHYRVTFDNRKWDRAYSVACGRVNGRYVSMRMIPEDMERMYHELGVLAGRLTDLSCKDDPNAHCTLPSWHRSRVLGFLRRHRPIPPTAKSIEPRHPA